MSTINAVMNRSEKKTAMSSFMAKYGLAFFALLCVVVFSIMEPKFLGLTNILNIITATSVMGVTAMGLSLVMSFGEIDFAVGMELTLTAIIMGVVIDKQIVSNYPMAIIVGLVIAVVFGLVNAFLHIIVGIPAFIATMGTSFIATGLAFYLTNGLYISSQRWPKIFTFIGQGFVLGKVPVMILFLLVLSIVIWIYTELTTNGKTMYAVGSNTDACNYVGIDIRKEKLKGFILCSVLCGIAGIMLASQLNRVGYQMGDSSLMTSLTAILLGATFLKPGVINIPGTILGALIVSILNNGLTMVSAPNFARDITLALVMIISISLVTIIRRRSEKTE